MASDSDSETKIPEDLELRARIDRSLRRPVMFFFASGAAWLAVALILGFISSFQSHDSRFLAGYEFFNYGRVYPAHVNVLVYGWGCQAAFGLIVWLMARLSRKECSAAGIPESVVGGWNSSPPCDRRLPAPKEGCV